jgi:F-type H+-transporting ATPase subunit gamma
LKDTYGEELNIKFFPVGKKMAKAMHKYVESNPEMEMIHIDGVDSKMTGDVVNDFTLNLQESFTNGDIDLLEVVYMKFLTIGKQVPTAERLFPVDKDAVAHEAEGVKLEDKLYIFEPDANSIFNQVLPMFVLSLMQEVTIENRSSEQAARIMAMQSANDNAKKLLESLQLEYNKLRQQGITTELLDILGGQVQN